MALARFWNRMIRNWVCLDTDLHLHGNAELQVENCLKILEYNEVLVRLQTRDMRIAVWGTDLRVFDYNDSGILVRGRITSVSLEETRRWTHAAAADV